MRPTMFGPRTTVGAALLQSGLLAPGTAADGRPPPGLARGLVVVPEWAVVAVASALIVGALAYLLWQQRQGRKP